MPKARHSAARSYSSVVASCRSNRLWIVDHVATHPHAPVEKLGPMAINWMAFFQFPMPKVTSLTSMANSRIIENPSLFPLEPTKTVQYGHSQTWAAHDSTPWRRDHWLAPRNRHRHRFEAARWCTPWAARKSIIKPHMKKKMSLR